MLTLNADISHVLYALVQLAHLLQAILEHGVDLASRRMRRYTNCRQWARSGQHLHAGDVIVRDDVLVTVWFSTAVTAFIWNLE